MNSSMETHCAFIRRCSTLAKKPWPRSTPVMSSPGPTSVCGADSSMSLVAPASARCFCLSSSSAVLKQRHSSERSARLSLMICRTCSSAPSICRQPATSRSSLRARWSLATMASARSRAIQVMPSAGDMQPPSHAELAPIPHLWNFANSKSAPAGPMMVCHLRSALTVRFTPTMVRCGSSVYISISKSRAKEPYWSPPRERRRSSHSSKRGFDSARALANVVSSSSNIFENNWTSALASR